MLVKPDIRAWTGCCRTISWYLLPLKLNIEFCVGFGIDVCCSIFGGIGSFAKNGSVTNVIIDVVGQNNCLYFLFDACGLAFRTCFRIFGCYFFGPVKELTNSSAPLHAYATLEIKNAETIYFARAS
jgi:hypothetical protein